MFEKFNLIQYSLTHDGKKLTDYILTDITTRAKLRVADDALLKFEVQPNERPEDVSQEVYGTPYYHWVIMMINDIYDINAEWFMADEQLYSYCKAKYNKTHTILPANISVANNSFTVTGHPYKPNDVVTVNSDELPGGLYENTEYYIYNTTANTFQLTPTLESTTPIDITSVSTSSITVTCNVADQPAYWIDDQNNIMSTALDLYNGWSNNEDTLNEYKNKMNEIISTQPSRRSYIPATSKSVVDLGNDIIEVTDEVTPPDQIQNRFYRVITNFEYESMMNERRRVIRILKPEYIKTFIDKFNAAVSK